ncbi:conserved hypothetical protein [Trichinella spiralis]|uniref:hypothetical protein n=1 Tax=Trichinella spiralis TaxID=6334 RepID=UPI0001EFEC64|nr:conserved hypothetical protein [Trichinella spiralis]
MSSSKREICRKIYTDCGDQRNSPEAEIWRYAEFYTHSLLRMTTICPQFLIIFLKRTFMIVLSTMHMFERPSQRQDSLRMERIKLHVRITRNRCNSVGYCIISSVGTLPILEQEWILLYKYI